MILKKNTHTVVCWGFHCNYHWYQWQGPFQGVVGCTCSVAAGAGTSDTSVTSISNDSVGITITTTNSFSTGCTIIICTSTIGVNSIISINYRFTTRVTTHNCDIYSDIALLLRLIVGLLVVITLIAVLLGLLPIILTLLVLFTLLLVLLGLMLIITLFTLLSLQLVIIAQLLVLHGLFSLILLLIVTILGFYGPFRAVKIKKKTIRH